MFFCKPNSDSNEITICKNYDKSTGVFFMIPYGKHYIDEDDIQAVVNVLKYGMLTQGPQGAEFES